MTASPSCARAHWSSRALLLTALVFSSACSSALAPDDPARLTDLGIRVVVSAQAPFTPGSGFRVRAENRAGMAVEGTTDDTGAVDLRVDLSAGPWDVTLAKPGHVIVSLWDVTEPLSEPVLAYRFTPPPREPVAPHVLRGTISGRTREGTTVRIQGAGVSTVETRTDSFETRYSPYLSPETLQLVAVEWEDELSPVNAVVLPETPHGDADAVIDIALPVERPETATSLYLIELPTAGLLTSEAVLQVYGGSATSVGLTRNTTWATVGRSTSTRTPNGFLSGIVMLQGAFRPDFATLSFTFGTSPSRSGTVWAEEFPAEQTVTIGEVRTLEISGASLGELRVTTDGVGYQHAVVYISDSGPITGTWRCITFRGANVSRRALPHLPTGLSLRDLGFENDSAGVHLSMAQTRPGAPPPWAVDGYRAVWIGTETQEISIAGR